MEDFAVKFALATMYVMIGGGILAWVLNYISDKMDELSQMTMEDCVGGMIGIGIIIIVALLI
jgi:hypothetical protein